MASQSWEHIFGTPCVCRSHHHVIIMAHYGCGPKTRALYKSGNFSYLSLCPDNLSTFVVFVSSGNLRQTEIGPVMLQIIIPLNSDIY